MSRLPSTIWAPKGEPGDKGPIGDQGPIGDKGPPGDKADTQEVIDGVVAVFDPQFQQSQTERTQEFEEFLAVNQEQIEIIPLTAASVSADKSTVLAARDQTLEARDTAIALSGIYADIATGLAATTPGKVFGIPTPNNPFAISLYANISGAAVFTGAKLSSFEAVASLQNLFPSVTPIGYALAFTDGNFKAAAGIKDNGALAAAVAELLLVIANEIKLGETLLSSAVYPGYKAVMADGAGKAALAISDAGVVETESLKSNNITVNTLNGFPYFPSALSRQGGIFSSQWVFINNFGQSLAEGSTPATALTTLQEYGNLGFPARSLNPTTLVPLTVVNTQVANRGESPMYGTLGNIKELLVKENGIKFTENDYQLITCNNGYSGFSILSLNKGTAPYAAVMSQAKAAYDLALSAGKTFLFQCSTWTQGEADAAMTKDVYKGYLKQLATDLNTDAKALIPSQFKDHLLITYQCASADRKIAIAQLEASNESGLIVMACPMYQFDYGDSQHINAVSSKWLGGYYAIANKRTFIDNKEWKPLQPIGHEVNGNTLDLFFNRTGLVLDTNLIPAQVDLGFQVRDASNVITISSISVLSPNRVRLVLSGNPAPGWVVRYGYNSAVGKGAFVGGCGNLRDSQGDTVVYSAIDKPMHNWCVIFNYQL